MDKIIVGVMCVSGLPEILNISIPNLIKHSNYTILLLDNETKEVEDLVLDYQRRYYDKVFVRRSSIPGKLINKNGTILDKHKRWKSVKSYVRDEMFVNIRRMTTHGLIPEPDIILVPDSDEIFTDYLPELLDSFWVSEYKAVALKMIHVVGDMQTIKDDKMMHHVHVLKWQDDLCGIPWQFQNQFHPVKWSETMKVNYYSVHLCYLTAENRKWRNDNWKSVNIDEERLIRLDKSVETIRPEDIEKIVDN